MDVDLAADRIEGRVAAVICLRRDQHAGGERAILSDDDDGAVAPNSPSWVILCSSKSTSASQNQYQKGEGFRYQISSIVDDVASRSVHVSTIHDKTTKVLSCALFGHPGATHFPIRLSNV
jgi:hypothetical protein